MSNLLPVWCAPCVSHSQFATQLNSQQKSSSFCRKYETKRLDQRCRRLAIHFLRFARLVVVLLIVVVVVVSKRRFIFLLGFRSVALSRNDWPPRLIETLNCGAANRGSKPADPIQQKTTQSCITLLTQHSVHTPQTQSRPFFGLMFSK